MWGATFFQRMHFLLLRQSLATSQGMMLTV